MKKKDRKQAWPLYSADSETTCRILKRVSDEDGRRQEALGNWERRYDTVTGEMIGWRVKVRIVDDSELKSKPTPASIAPAEMELNAFAQVFADARSRTARMDEVQRLERAKNGREPEDKAERTIRKVLVWPHVGPARGDILRAWPVRA